MTAELLAYARTWPGASEQTLVWVSIGRTTYLGVRYRTADGETRYYVLGDLPASYRRDPRMTYRHAGSIGDWFIAGYADARTVAIRSHRTYHKLGVWFGLHRGSRACEELYGPQAPTMSITIVDVD